jgi:hypothetical protein
MDDIDQLENFHLHPEDVVKLGNETIAVQPVLILDDWQLLSATSSRETL